MRLAGVTCAKNKENGIARRFVLFHGFLPLQRPDEAGRREASLPPSPLHRLHCGAKASGEHKFAGAAARLQWRMAKIKGLKGREVPPEAPSVQTQKGRPKKVARREIDAASSESQPRKRAKTAAVTGIKESSTAAPSLISGKIQIEGGAVECVGLDKALRALCRHVQKLQQQEETPDLLAGSGGPTVCLMFSLQNIPERQRVIPYLIELPHSPLDANSEVCLIVKDPQRKWKDLVAATSSLSSVTKVISHRKLPKKFPQFADRRALCAAYDQFLVDTKVKEKVYNSLGKVFFSANKMSSFFQATASLLPFCRLPLPIRVGATTLEREVGKALRSTSLVLKRGPSVAVKIGKAFAPPEQLFANAVAAIKGVSAFLQQNPKWKNTVTTIHVQATNTPALPVYLHPKYAQTAEHYFHTKPPCADTNKEQTKKQQAIQEALKTPNKVELKRRTKRSSSAMKVKLKLNKHKQPTW
ncbi:hypothetical protein Esti_001918 [Eimeria stiedai]